MPGHEAARRDRKLVAVGAVVLVLLVAWVSGSAWPVVAAMLLAMSVWALRGWFPRRRGPIALTADRRADLRKHADQQNSWALRGDDRGVYGPDGARLMRIVSDDPPAGTPLPDPDQIPDIADIADIA